MTEKTEKHARYVYLDSVASALTDYERKLNSLIERLNKAADNLLVLTNPETPQQIVEDNKQPEEDVKSLLKTARNILI
jgi:hypothetical protein